MKILFKVVLLLFIVSAAAWFAPRVLLPVSSERKDLQHVETARSITITGANVPLRIMGPDSSRDVSSSDGTIDDTVQVIAKNRPGCGITAQIRRDGETLAVDISKNAIPLAWWCNNGEKVKVMVVPPVPLRLEVDKKDLLADIEGVFRAVNINGLNAVVNFDGVTDRFQMRADHAVVNLDFAADMARDAIVLDVESLVSHVTFGN